MRTIKQNNKTKQIPQKKQNKTKTKPNKLNINLPKTIKYLSVQNNAKAQTKYHSA